MLNYFLNGLSRMEGLWERGGNGMGAGTGTPFRDKPPGCLERVRWELGVQQTRYFDTTGGGGVVSKGCVE